MYSGICGAEYRTLSDIAPTITQTDEYLDYGVPWQVTTETLGRAQGSSEQAADLVTVLVTDIERRFAAARAANPQWADMTAVVVAGPGRPPGRAAGRDAADAGGRHRDPGGLTRQLPHPPRSPAIRPDPRRSCISVGYESPEPA